MMGRGIECRYKYLSLLSLKEQGIVLYQFDNFERNDISSYLKNDFEQSFSLINFKNIFDIQ